jgi:hypothetical protein
MAPMNLLNILRRTWDRSAMSSAEYWHVAYEQPEREILSPTAEAERQLAETIGGDCVRCRRNLREHGSTMCIACDWS